MASKLDFRYFDVKIDKSNVEDGIWDIFSTLRPEWTKEDLRTETYTAGFVNSMPCFYQERDKERVDALVVRVYGREDFVILEREKEFLTLQVAQAAGCFPPVLASFANGLVYRFEPGRIANFHDLTNPRHIKTVAHLLYKYHHMDVDNTELFNRKGEPEKYDKTPKSIEIIPTLLKSIPAVPKDASIAAAFQKARAELRDEYLMGEYEFVKGIADDANLSTTLVHGDFHPRNIIINDETGKITFIDYESAGFNHECFDLARLFDIKPDYYQHGLCAADEPDITDDIKTVYFREYLTARNKEMGKDGAIVTPEEIELLRAHTKIINICNNMLFQVYALMFVDMKLKDITVFDILPKYRSLYLEQRGDLPALRDRCLDLQNQIVSIWMNKRYAAIYLVWYWNWDSSRGMMPSSNGNIFRVTGPLCGEFTGHQWIPRTKASDAELWCFLWSPPQYTVE